MFIYISKKAQTEEEYITIREAVKSGTDISKSAYFPESVFKDIEDVFDKKRSDRLTRILELANKKADPPQRFFQAEPYKLTEEQTKTLMNYCIELVDALEKKVDVEELEERETSDLTEKEKKHSRLYSYFEEIESVCKVALDVGIMPTISLN